MGRILQLGESAVWSEIATARKHGLNCSKLSGIGGELVIEAPVSINSANFHGGCRLGFLSYIGPGATVTMADIGRFCSIAPNVCIAPAEHPLDWLSTHPFQYRGTRQFDGHSEYEGIAACGVLPNNAVRTVIGNDVLIGEGAFIKRGVTIGDGAVVGARAVVTKDVPPYTIVAGNPAKAMRPRFDRATVARLLSVKWWDYDLSSLGAAIPFSNVPQALNELEETISAGRLERLAPKIYSITGRPVLNATRTA